MVKLALIRHGTTDWNRRHIVQGSTDIPLDEMGREEVNGWLLPPAVKTFRLIASPLSRAKETALILSGRHPETDNRLSEMSWGDWEGSVLDELRQKFGDLMAAWEAKGLDFKSPNGESPREVQIRLTPLLKEISQGGEDTLAVCHKGVIRAIYAMADNWDMTSKPKQKLRDGCLHLFELDNYGHPKISELNVNMVC